ncbi:HDOD domain-containing protein [Simiduia aestuariiviva]|uniref:HD-like signal output (HDOD) protein/prolyl-tRNA editing enzyme YbaK/EbsC (Cys-tRNA(Pro) deacylase) n=1 Tax=Simiduia aestuariiviva TaxID=1510459 RepID=A0A839UV11_9GAMM|nr:HD-like signal output (HDOD) protein/prolyl-tRNA editing enzyme YbaK/EbsC (Cys-tRNA(Pro) deacylase) [Simiduia aestuariiviva]
MPLSASIIQFLDQHELDYQLTEPLDTPMWHDQQLRNKAAARATLLEDEREHVLAIFPADSLLDLAAVNKILGRNMVAMCPKTLRKLFEKYELSSIPALPGLGGLTSIIDQQLLDRPKLYLDPGSRAQLLELPQKEFTRLAKQATTGQIAIPLASLESVIEGDDTSIITNSIKQFTALRVKERLEETLELPPLPDTAQRIIQLRVNPNADISDLAHIVETDPSLASQVVSWAASPYYSAPGKIKSIHDAIVRVLGFDMVLNLSLGLSLGKTLSMPQDGVFGINRYWQQSVYMAAAMEGLVTAIPRDHRPGFGMAYLSGLVFNFGYLVMAEVFPPYFTKLCRSLEANPHVDHPQIEKHLLGVTRDHIASWLMELWNMPEEVVFALRYQNQPDCQGELAAYAKLLFVARRLLAQRGMPCGPRLEVPAQVYLDLHLDPVKAEATIDNILESSAELEHIASQMAPAA